MAKSAEFKAMFRRFSILRARLLPHTFDPTGTYSEEAHDLVRAFLLLVNAEIEGYLKARVAGLAVSAGRAWDSRKVASSIAMGLGTFYAEKRTVPGRPPVHGSKMTLSDRLEGAVNRLVAGLRSVYGVQVHNLMKILVPIGVGGHFKTSHGRSGQNRPGLSLTRTAQI